MNTTQPAEKENPPVGRLIRIAGPVVAASGLEDVRLYDVVHVGEIGLVGEVIRLAQDLTTIQVYEDTSGLRIGEPVINTQRPLVARLGPGLLGSVYDGLQRPLEALATLTGSFIARGVNASPLPEEKEWDFTPLVPVGEMVHPGDILGVLPETQAIQHRIMVPPGIAGQVVEIRAGKLKQADVVARISSPAANRGEPPVGHEIYLSQTWPVRQPRPALARQAPREPLVTGTRIIDALFPVAKGGAAIIPGGFGTGKTVVEHSLACWANADVVIYVGCGERGNEMTEVLEEFPHLVDPRTGASLMERTVLIANTSNMPVAAREASIYTGITIAEYYRDMGYDVLILADSTSRWGEALREISGRLEEMPGEEGYPAYLAARLAEYYERSGRVTCLGTLKGEPRLGSVSVVGAVSPPGGDFSEPITQNSMRLVGTFWALDYDLSRRRHFPAINWSRSYCLYHFQDWFRTNVRQDWPTLVAEAQALLQREVELLEIVRLVGSDALVEAERGILAVSRMLREDFLQQSAYHAIDRYCPLAKSYWMLLTILNFYHAMQKAMEGGTSLLQITALPVVAGIARMKEIPPEEAEPKIKALIDRIEYSFAAGFNTASVAAQAPQVVEQPE